MVPNGIRWCQVVQGGARWYKVVPGGTRWCHSQVIPGVFLFQDSIFPVQLTEVAVVTCGKTEQNYKPGPLTTFFRVCLETWPPFPAFTVLLSLQVTATSS